MYSRSMGWVRLIAATAVALLPAGTAFGQTAPVKEGTPAPMVPPAPPAPPPVVMVPPAAPRLPAPDATRLALGRELADLLNGERVTRIQTVKLFDETMPKQLMAQPEFAALEKRYPGIAKFVIARMRPVIERETWARLPGLIDRLGRIYAEAMDAADLRGALAFYHGPTGQMLIQRVAEGWDMSSIVQASMQDPEHTMTERDLSTAVGGAALSAFANMPPEERDAIIAFAVSQPGRAVTRSNPQIARAAAEWANEMPAEVKRAAQEAATSAAFDYMKQYDAAHPVARDGAAPAPSKP